MNERTAKGLIETMVLADGFDLSELRSTLQDHYEAARQGDALHITCKNGGSVFVFDYGVVVTWSMSRSEVASLLKILLKYAQRPLSDYPVDNFVCKLSQDQVINMVDDKINIPDSEPNTLLSLSHALAQSAKLSIFETTAEQTIEDNKYLTEELRTNGKIPLSRKNLSKLRGALFQTKSDILLHFNLLDTPDFFWNHPALESNYQVVAKYLEITPRINLLRIKLGTIKELFDMLAAEQNHKHSSFLEWIIILLIALEIVLFFVH